ncbi:OmpW/AlkL family protein [Burkholderia sp. MSMB1835]|uniref:OmpW/AlkL family protein n=1 Tax=Burkholderia sp. MSMB1835 TaxID=1637876 RepID=UPI00075516D6|nr:OmpW family outer membrane protein [Burkholderia sp. MSMB1835]KVL37247.1 hypothetical protein WS96_10105 [Burkholderia sp. MSMB1835]
MSNYWKNIRPAVVAGFFCSVALAGNANAQSAGSFTLSTGWLHAAPLGDATPLTVTSVDGIAVNQKLSGTGAHALSTDTLGINGEYYMTDNIGIAALVGLPLTGSVQGKGTFAKYGTLGTTRPMPPVIELRYHLFEAQSKFRPFVGLGVNYTWFTQVRVTNGQFITNSVGPGGSVHATLSASWNPVFDVGANYALSKHWSVGAAVGYIPLKTHLTIYGQTATGTQTVTKSTLRINPINVFLNVGYTF